MVKDSRLKKEVQEFYDTIGWRKKAGTLYEDAHRFEDLRPVSSDYVHRCHMRVKRYLRESGRYLLDAGAGPIQFSEYLEYSMGYRFRVCLDLSMTALREARDKLGDKGLYILGDIVNLPFRENAFGAVVSLHTIYHVPADEQKAAFLEIHRVLESGATAAVVYSWGDHSALMFLPVVVPRKTRALSRKLTGTIYLPKHQDPELYFFPHNYRWVRRNLMEVMDLDIVVWRSVSVPFLRQYIMDNHIGRQTLRFIYWLEEKLPRWAGRWGQYPLIIIRR